MTEAMSDLSFEAKNLGWLLNGFVRKVPGVREAVVLSADGLPMAVSEGLDRDSAERFSAVASGLVGLAQGLQVSGGAEGVGRATTNAVVYSIILIIVADCLLTVAFYF